MEDGWRMVSGRWVEDGWRMVSGRWVEDGEWRIHGICMVCIWDVPE